MTRTALFPGSFDPFTLGHYDIVCRGLELFDHIVIAVGINSDKHCRFSLDERLAHIRSIFDGECRVRVISYNGLTVDAAREVDAHFLLRGVRSVADYEYERTIADANAMMSDVQTVLLMARAEHAAISSSLVREMLRFGKDVAHLMPPHGLL